jgi:hypothetical protein
MASDKHNTQLNLFSLTGSWTNILVYKADDTTKGQKRKGDLLEVKLSKKGRKVILDTKNSPNKLQLVKAAKTGNSMLDYKETKYKSL